LKHVTVSMCGFSRENKRSSRTSALWRPSTAMG